MNQEMINERWVYDLGDMPHFVRLNFLPSYSESYFPRSPLISLPCHHSAGGFNMRLSPHVDAKLGCALCFEVLYHNSSSLASSTMSPSFVPFLSFIGHQPSHPLWTRLVPCRLLLLYQTLGFLGLSFQNRKIIFYFCEMDEKGSVILLYFFEIDIIYVVFSYKWWSA